MSKNAVLVCPICKSNDVLVKIGTRSTSRGGSLKEEKVQVNVCNECGHQWFTKLPPQEAKKPPEISVEEHKPIKKDYKTLFGDKPNK